VLVINSQKMSIVILRRIPVFRTGGEMCLRITKENCQSTITNCFRNVSSKAKPNLRDVGSTKGSTKPSPVKLYNQKQRQQNTFWKRFDKFFEVKEQPPIPSKERNRTSMMYVASAVMFTVGATYAAVPLYRIFCQETGYGGTTQKGHDKSKVGVMKAKKDRVLTVKFNADIAATMRWNFRPQQSEVKLFAGETALAFYTAKNPTEKPIDGISTYNVVPFEAGQYFNKIQCFCFEEQRLNPGEEVDMPVFFYIDPEFLDDPNLEKDDIITLSYTFFESRPGLVLPNMSQ